MTDGIHMTDCQWEHASAGVSHLCAWPVIHIRWQVAEPSNLSLLQAVRVCIVPPQVSILQFACMSAFIRQMLMLFMAVLLFTAFLRWMYVKDGTALCRPANFFEVNPGINLPPSVNTASVEVGNSSCCGGSGNGAITKEDEIRDTQADVSRHNCCASSSCSCSAGCTCSACGCRARALRAMQPKL